MNHLNSKIINVAIFLPQDFTIVNMQIIMILHCLQLVECAPDDCINRQKTGSGCWENYESAHQTKSINSDFSSLQFQV